MSLAAVALSLTNHPGLIPAGLSTVLINGRPAARADDAHTCLLPPLAGPHPPNTIAQGSTTVTIGGQPAARVGDVCGCGASIVSGALNVTIGG